MNALNTPTIIALVSLGLNILFGAFVILANPRRSTNRQFVVLTVFGSLWLTGLACSFSSKNEATFLFSLHLTTAMGALVPLGFRWVRLAMENSVITCKELLSQSRLQLVMVFGLAVFSWTDLHVTGATFPKDGIPDTVNGPLVVLYGLGFLGLCLNEVRLLIIARRAARGIQRFELNFMLMAAGFMIVLGALPALFVPLIADNSQGVSMAPLWIVFMDGVIAYGIATRRIMDVNAVMRLVTSWVLLVAYIVASYALVFTLVTLTGADSWNDVASIPCILVSVALVLGFGWVQNRLDVFLNRAFVSKDRVDPMKDWENARQALIQVTTTPQLLERFSGMLSKTANTNRAEVHLLADGERYPAVSDQLKRVPKPLLVSALARQRGGAENESILKELAAEDWELAMGIYREEGLVGVVCLAERDSGRIYSQEEQLALMFIVSQFSGALENATLYTEVANRERYNKTLLDNLLSGVISTDLKGNVTVANPVACRILSSGGPTELLPKPLRGFLEEVLETGQAQQDVEMEVSIEPGPVQTLRVGGRFFQTRMGNQSVRCW